MDDWAEVAATLPGAGPAAREALDHLRAGLVHGQSPAEALAAAEAWAADLRGPPRRDALLALVVARGQQRRARQVPFGAHLLELLRS